LGPILVIDDDWSFRQLVGNVLLADGIDVEVAADGQEALVRAAARRPALVLLDWIMPGPHPAVTAAILRSALGPDIPLVLMSGWSGASELARDLGAVAYLHKPFEIEQLLATVRTALCSAQSSTR
jgi:DNA-binding response OmpR family regulator